MFILGHIGLMLAVVVFVILRKKPAWRNRFDIRYLALGAVLPDIIDKTIGLFILQDQIDNGRIFAHTLLFSVILTLIAFRSGSRFWVCVSLGAWTHIAFDKMWEVPGTIVWPAFGLGFPKTGFYPGRWIEMLYTDPYIYVSEILGALVLLYLFLSWKLYRKNNWKKLWNTGKIPMI